MFLDKLKMEFFGTFMLVLLQGMMIVQMKTEAVDLLALAIGSFAVYSLVLWAGKSLSGAQYNPVISLSLIMTRHVKLSKGLSYIAFQILGAIFAMSVLRISIPKDLGELIADNSMLGFPVTETPIGAKIAFEAIGTFFITLAYYMLLLEKNAPKHVFGAGIAAVYSADTLFMFQKSGCGINPARMFAYCIFSNDFSTSYIYLIGPLVGGLLGSALGNFLLSEKAEAAKLRIKEDKRRRTIANVVNKPKVL